ncbi:MAG: RNA polymerase sigma factor [Terriglobales bacterium]
MTPTIPAELISLSGEQRISELDDIDALVRAYKPKVFRFVAFSLSDRDAAESITQDCFLKAHLSRNQFRGDCSVGTWLMRIAFNLVRDHTKSQKFRFWKSAAASAIDASDLSQYLASGASSAEAQLIARERVQMVYQALRELSGKQRSVFLMRFVEELELSDIAAITGMTLPTVKTHLYRAVGAVRARLGAAL